MIEVGQYAKLAILCGLIALLKDSSLQVKADMSLTEVPIECTEGSVTGDCLQLIFTRYGDSKSISLGRFEEFLTNIGLGKTATDHEDHHHDHNHAHEDHHDNDVSNGTNSTTGWPVGAGDTELIMFGDNHTTDDHIRKVRYIVFLLVETVHLHCTV